MSADPTARELAVLERVTGRSIGWEPAYRDEDGHLVLAAVLDAGSRGPNTLRCAFMAVGAEGLSYWEERVDLEQA